MFAGSAGLALGGWVTARLTDGSTHRGVLHTVDPETGALVLLRPDEVFARHTANPHMRAPTLPRRTRAE